MAHIPPAVLALLLLALSGCASRRTQPPPSPIAEPEVVVEIPAGTKAAGGSPGMASDKVQDDFYAQLIYPKPKKLVCVPGDPSCDVPAPKADQIEERPISRPIGSEGVSTDDGSILCQSMFPVFAMLIALAVIYVLARNRTEKNGGHDV